MERARNISKSVISYTKMARGQKEFLSNRLANVRAQRRRTYEKLTLNSYLNVCVDVGQIHRAFNLLLKYTRPKPDPNVDVQHYNTILKGWAKLGSIAQIVETRMLMIRNNVEPNRETFGYLLLGFTKNSTTKVNSKNRVRKLLNEMKNRDIDPRTIFQTTYLNMNERRAIKNMLRTVDPKFEELFCPEPIDYNCKLLNSIKQIEHRPYHFGGPFSESDLESWSEHQRSVEWKSSLTIKSVANIKESPAALDKYIKIWQRHYELWRKTLSKALDQAMESLQTQCAIYDKIHLYPYLCSVDKNMLIHLMLDEIETNATFSTYSSSTHHLHLQFGTKVMTRYIRAKSIGDGSHQEKLKIYHDYLLEYCTNPELMGRINSREYIQEKAAATKNYAIYRDRFSPVEEWPHHIVASVGRFLYGLILHEVKFDPDSIKYPKRELKPENMVHAFYTAYFQIDSTHKIKEEFRAHQDFEKLHSRACSVRLKFDYSFLPCSSPPLPWLSYGFGGYLTNKSDLVRISSPFAEQVTMLKMNLDTQKLYPSLDSLNALSLCPWIVNKEILDLVIDLFRSGGDEDLSVPLDESRMKFSIPKLTNDASKADRILYNKEKKKFDQKRKETYSLWRDCLYRLSIANHFRDRIFWFPHNTDFRGRTYPIPPHFNHLGSDLARSLLLFAKGEPLGEKGLDWLKIHLINLVGNKKSASMQERLDYANSILHLEVLDSADNPWDGRRWWTRNECPWQVLACCKEIAKAIRSKDHRQYISHFPVHQDGSCNGLQHYAALGRDIGGATAVNLVPCDRPQDVYSRVVDLVEKARDQDAAAGNNLAKSLEGYIQRKVIKQTVMTTVYGVTRYGARLQIARQLVSKGYKDREVWSASHYLAAKTFESIGQMFKKSRMIQDWLNNCAYIIASKYDQPVSWETPLGFPVIQPYTVPHSNSTNRLMSASFGSDVPLYNDPLSRLNTSKQKTAFPPNYIHSLDSSHMMLTSLFCQRAGITFVSVHDCFWTHPNTVDVMNRICRQQFVALHSEPLLQNLSEQFVNKYSETTYSESDETDCENIEKQSQRINVSDSQVLAAKIVDYSLKHSGDSLPNSLLSSHICDNQLVNEDLRRLLLEEDNEEIVDDEIIFDNGRQKVRRLTSEHSDERQSAAIRSNAIFRQVPETGQLDLKTVLNSTYFFS